MLWAGESQSECARALSLLTNTAHPGENPPGENPQAGGGSPLKRVGSPLKRKKEQQ